MYSMSHNALLSTVLSSKYNCVFYFCDSGNAAFPSLGLHLLCFWNKTQRFLQHKTAWCLWWLAFDLSRFWSITTKIDTAGALRHITLHISCVSVNLPCVSFIYTLRLHKTHCFCWVSDKTRTKVKTPSSRPPRCVACTQNSISLTIFLALWALLFANCICRSQPCLVQWCK